jgi:hypothetical protein
MAARFAVGIAGRAILTEDKILPGQRSAHTLQLEAGTSFGPVHPDVFYRKPLGQEEFSDFVKFVFGISVTVEL